MGAVTIIMSICSRVAEWLRFFTRTCSKNIHATFVGRAVVPHRLIS